MIILYYDSKTEEICNDLKKATKYMGGNKQCAISLLARINALRAADVLKDIVKMPQFHFHKLENKGKNNNLEGYFSIDVKTRRDKWRVILEPLDDNENSFIPCNIDEIAKKVRIVEIREVSNHYDE